MGLWLEFHDDIILKLRLVSIMLTDRISLKKSYLPRGILLLQ